MLKFQRLIFCSSPLLMWSRTATQDARLLGPLPPRWNSWLLCLAWSRPQQKSYYTNAALIPMSQVIFLCRFTNSNRWSWWTQTLSWEVPHERISVEVGDRWIGLISTTMGTATAGILHASWWLSENNFVQEEEWCPPSSTLYSKYLILFVPSITIYFEVHCFLKVVSRLFLLMLITCSLKSNSSV